VATQQAVHSMRVAADNRGYATSTVRHGEQNETQLEGPFTASTSLLVEAAQPTWTEHLPIDAIKLGEIGMQAYGESVDAADDSWDAEAAAAAAAAGAPTNAAGAMAKMVDNRASA